MRWLSITLGVLALGALLAAVLLPSAGAAPAPEPEISNPITGQTLAASNACDEKHPDQGQDTQGHQNPSCRTPPATATLTPAITSTRTATATSTSTQTPTPTAPPLPDLVVKSMKIELQFPGSCDTSGGLGVRVVVSNVSPVFERAADVEVNGAVQDVVWLPFSPDTSAWFPGYSNGLNVAIVDPLNKIAESNEANNTLAELLLIPTPPLPCTSTPTPTISPAPTATPTAPAR